MDVPRPNVDLVFIKGLKFETVVGPDAWHRQNKLQPVEIDVTLTPLTGLDAAAQEDNVSFTIDYGKLYKQLTGIVTGQSFESVHHLSQTVRAKLPVNKAFVLQITLPKSILLADHGVSFKWESYLSSDGTTEVVQCMTIDNISCKCIIGVNPHERIEKQRLEISIRVDDVENRLSPEMLAGVSMNPVPVPVYQAITTSVVDRVEGSSYETVESLATAIAQLVTMIFGFNNARVTIHKPSAIAGIQAAGVTIGRSRDYFENKDFWKVKRT